MFEFQNLEVYKKAKVFHLESKQLIHSIKPDKTVKDQLSRASFSIALNIAEGSGRFSKADRRNFFIVSRGSVFECMAILDILHDSGSIDQKVFESFLQKGDELSRILYAMIKNLSWWVVQYKHLIEKQSESVVANSGFYFILFVALLILYQILAGNYNKITPTILSTTCLDYNLYL